MPQTGTNYPSSFNTERSVKRVCVHPKGSESGASRTMSGSHHPKQRQQLKFAKECVCIEAFLRHKRLSLELNVFVCCAFFVRIASQ